MSWTGALTSQLQGAAKGSPTLCREACPPWLTYASLPESEINDAGTAYWL